MWWPDRLVLELLTPLAMWVFVSGLEDLFLDLCYAWCWWRGRFRRKGGGRAPDRFQRIALLVPCWHEANVIEHMLDDNVAGIDYPNYQIWLGVYPNDPETFSRVLRAERRHPNVRHVMLPHDGPTTKADCLNHLLAGIFVHEETTNDHFDIFFQHDAEDRVHPLELRTANRILQDYGMVQLPVLALETPLRRLTHGVYCDEFADSHLRELPVRAALGGFVPSAGVGTGLRRELVLRLREKHGGNVFDRASLTEDYFLGLQAHELGVAQSFAVERAPNGEFIATRAYFPMEFMHAIRQRTRWIIGNSLQSWEKFGWRGSLGQFYWLWRDRRGLVNHPISLLVNVVFVFGLARWASAASAGEPWVLGNEIASRDLLMSLIFANGSFLVWRQLVRGTISGQVYGWAHGWTVLLRTVWSNGINGVAVLRALFVYGRARLLGRPLRWAKTVHVYPGAASAMGPTLPEILIARGWVSQVAVEEALAAGPLGDLGLRLLAQGLITESQLYEALAEEHHLPFVKAPAATIAGADLPPDLLALVRVQACRDEVGRQWLVAPQPPSLTALFEIPRELLPRLRFAVVTPTSYRRLAGAARAAVRRG